MMSKVLLLPRSSLKNKRLFLTNCLRTLANSSNSMHDSFTQRYQILEFPHVAPQQADYKFRENKIYHGFECTRTEMVSDFNITSYTFKHRRTGTELWYLDRNDPNNVFSINFRTTPFDSSGLPHILEHSVLCGSEKYPVRDPFFKMLTRSVATFMNAMTGPDYTLYPFSSMNETDYRNLQKIYLDAVFKPNLEYLDFLQEGWRLEHKDLRDKKSDYELKGVVYNEMKGAFSENSSIFGQNLLNSLLPDHTYGFVSGGNPLEIPKLTHENLKEFHKKYYHPSNARIFAYGSFNLSKTLQYVNEAYLTNYKRIDNNYSRIPSQPRWDKPKNVHIPSRLDSMGAPFEKQNQIAIALLTADICDIQETFLVYLISELLVRGPNSPFYKSFLEPNFSGGYSVVTGYDSQIKDTFFTVGLRDVLVEDFARVRELYDKTIRNVLEKGFDGSHIESILHNIELSIRHQSPQFGLGLLMNSTPLWNHEGDVVKSLHVGKMIDQFRSDWLKDPRLLQKKVEKYFADNQHMLTLTMSPDDHYEDNFKAAEANVLAMKTAKLTEEQREEIYENGLKLEESQKAVPNVDLLPCLKLNDVLEPPKTPQVNVVKIDDVPTQVCNVHTNDISYVKFYFDATVLKYDEVMLIPLFCSIITQMGTKKYDYREFDKVVVAKTGGIDFKLHFAENIYDSETYNMGVFMTTHALDKNVDDMFSLCKDLFTTYRFEDVDRFDMLLQNYMSSISEGITSSGHLYAAQSAAGLVTDAGKLKTQLAGLEHIEYMKNYVKEHKPEVILKKLDVVAQKLFNKRNMRIALNTSDEFYSSLVKYYKNFLNTLPGTDVEPIEHKVQLLEPSCQHVILNIPVNFCAKAFYAVPYTHRDHPTLRVLAKLISSKYLLPVVREQNGAYGAGAKLGADGIFSFYSYRDPNQTKTLEAFDNTYHWLQDYAKELTPHTLFEAKLGVLQQLDSPVAAGNIGIDFFLYGVSQEMFMKYRSRMLAVTPTDLHNVIEKYFKDPPAHYGKVILGPENPKLEELTNLKWRTIV